MPLPPRATVYNYWLGENQPGASPYGYVWPRHMRLANVAFVDGHCKALTVDALKQGVNAITGVITDPVVFLWDLN